MAKVFVLDDSKELLELFSFILEMKGHTVKIVSSGDKIIEQITAFNPDIILMDVRINYEDGRALCREIKKDKPLEPIPVILLSASPELLVNFKDCGAADTITKPFDIDTLTIKIEKLLAISNNEDRPAPHLEGYQDL